MSKINYPIERIRGIAFDVDGVLSPTVVPLGDDGIPRRMANLKDGFAMVKAVKAGLKMAIITGAVAPGLKERFATIGITDFYAGVGDKLEVLHKWMTENDLRPDEVAFVGDDLPDCVAMRHVGLGVAPRDAARDAIAAAKYVCNATGGYGVAREVIEEVMRAQGSWPAQSVAFG